MAVSEKDFRELSVTVEGIRGERRAWKFFPAAAVVVGLAALGWCWRISLKITAIEQRLADGGDTRLVAELTNPKSPQQLQANLTTISAQIQTARVEGKKPDTKKVTVLSTSVAQVIQKNPGVSEAWQAAAQLIDFRFAPTANENPPDCRPAGNTVYLQKNLFSSPNSEPRGFLFVGFTLQNCTLKLDDPSSILQTELFQDATHTPGIVPALELINVHVVYRGGEIIPVRALVFQNCTFEFTMNATPPSPMPSMIEVLLTTPNSKDIRFMS